MAQTKDYLDSILSDLEQAKLDQFVTDDVMREAVKKVLLAGIYGNGALEKGKPADPLRNFLIGYAFNKPDISNDQIGADLRAAVSGINTLETAFSNMAKYKREVLPPKGNKNQAR